MNTHPGKPIMNHPIAPHPYDPLWPVRFERERVALKTGGADLFKAVHHVGSTSIPGMTAKPVIDILVLLARYAGGSSCIWPIQALDYGYRGANGIEGRHYFNKGKPHTHHVHMLAAGHPRPRACWGFATIFVPIPRKRGPMKSSSANWPHVLRWTGAHTRKRKTHSAPGSDICPPVIADAHPPPSRFRGTVRTHHLAVSRNEYRCPEPDGRLARSGHQGNGQAKATRPHVASRSLQRGLEICRDQSHRRKPSALMPTGTRAVAVQQAGNQLRVDSGHVAKANHQILGAGFAGNCDCCTKALRHFGAMRHQPSLKRR